MSKALKAKAAAKRIAMKTPKRRRSDDPFRSLEVSKYAAAKPITGPRIARSPLRLQPQVEIANAESGTTYDRLASIAKYFAGSKALSRTRVPFSRVSVKRDASLPTQSVARPAGWRHPLWSKPLRPRPVRTRFHNHRWRIGRQQVSARSSIFQLRQLLGLPKPGLDIREASLTPEDVIFVALDTEFKRYGLVDRVHQLGVTTLDMRDISGMQPGLRAHRWTEKMRTTQLVTGVVSLGHTEPKGLTDCLFTSDIRRTSPDLVKAEFLRLLHGACHPHTNVHEERPVDASVIESGNQTSPEAKVHRRIVFVGHSIDNDFTMLRKDPHIQLDLLDCAQHGLSSAATFDTLDLADLATEHGADIPSKKLGRLVARLGVDPVFLRQLDPEYVKGTHNASNDAAYTMIALLLFALRWDELTLLPVRHVALRDSPLGLPLVTSSSLTSGAAKYRASRVPSWLRRLLQTWNPWKTA